VTSDALYHEELLRLARARTGAGRLEAPAASASRDNPLCGDRVAIDVRLEAGRIAAVAHRVRGCVLCEAAAALVGATAPGRAPAEVAAVRERLTAMLRAGAAPPDEPWAALGVFLPVRAVPSRHACVLMPFEALADALAQLRE
jgi:nitrogen fixation NifU-like protein